MVGLFDWCKFWSPNSNRILLSALKIGSIYALSTLRFAHSHRWGFLVLVDKSQLQNDFISSYYYRVRPEVVGDVTSLPVKVYLDL